MYKKKELLEKLPWEDVTEKLTWDEEGEILVGSIKHYVVVVKKPGKSRMKINPLFTTIGRGTFVPFTDGTFWLTTVKILDVKRGFCIERQRLLFLSSKKDGDVKDFGVHGC